MKEDDKRPFASHLGELRNRLIKSFVAVGVGFALSYAFKEKLFQILTAPLISVMKTGETLIYTNLPEAFFTFLKTAFLSGILLASPIIIYQFWMFTAPGLYQKEKRLFLPVVFLSSVFFIGGALFGYFIVFPFGFKFFIGFSNEYVKALPSVKQYFGFALKLLLLKRNLLHLKNLFQL